jgi:RNA binding exosome subunit
MASWTLEQQAADGKYIIPRKPTLEECTALNLDFDTEMRNHKRTVERLYKRNTADKRSQQRAQVKRDAIIAYTSVDDWVTRAVKPHQTKSRLLNPDKLPGYPDAPPLDHCASTEVHASIQEHHAELYREFRRERLKFQGKDAYVQQLARAAELKAPETFVTPTPFIAPEEFVQLKPTPFIAPIPFIAPEVCAMNEVEELRMAEFLVDTDEESPKRKRESEDDEPAKRQRVYKPLTPHQKAIKKQRSAERADIVDENRRKWQKDNYHKRAEKNKAYLKEWRQSEKGKQIAAHHHSKSASSVVQLSSSAAARGYEQSLHPDQVAVLCALPCIYCGVTDNINIDRVINTENYTLDNCVPCCTICNHMKSDYSIDKFITHRDRITNFKTTGLILHADNDGTFPRYYSSYKKSADKRGIEWSLGEDEFYILTKAGAPCFYCGDSNNCMGVDRKENNAGYSATNVVSCCALCNKLKWNLSVDAFLDKCRRGVDWINLHPIDFARSEILKKMPSFEQMATTITVHATQDARKVRKPPPEISPETPVYFLKSWKIKKFHLYLDCGGGRIAKDGAVKWQTFATQTIPRRLVPEHITLCLSCVNAVSQVHASAPAVTFESDAAALEWLQTASSAFHKSGVAAVEQPSRDAEQPSRDAERMRKKRAAETDEQCNARRARDLLSKRAKKAAETTI